MNWIVSMVTAMRPIKLLAPALLLVGLCLSVGVVFAGSIQIKVRHERLGIWASLDQKTLPKDATNSVSLGSKPASTVTVRASISGDIPGIKISEGKSLVFTPEDYATPKQIVISFPNQVTANQEATLTLEGAGLETKKITITAIAAGTFQPGLEIQEGSGTVTFAEYFQSLVNIGVIVAIAVSVLITVYAGIIYSKSQGEASKIALAKELVAGCLTGLAILLLIKLILPTLGIDVISTS